MKLRLIPQRVRATSRGVWGGPTVAPARRFDIAFERLFPLCFVPETQTDAGALAADLRSLSEPAAH